MRLVWSAVVDCVTPTSPEACVDQIELSSVRQIRSQVLQQQHTYGSVSAEDVLDDKKEKALVQNTCTKLLRMHDCIQVDCKHNKC